MSLYQYEWLQSDKINIYQYIVSEHNIYLYKA
jgi:hypothetical protein